VRTSPVPFVDALTGGLIVSCQPVRGGPLDDPAIVAATARAAEAGGARAVRLEGLADVRAARAATQLPIVGLVKAGWSIDEVFITPRLEDVDALVDAGADVVAFDGTLRPRAVAVSDMIARIHAAGAWAMADCATFEDGIAAAEVGADFIATTLSGYTRETASRDTPDFELVERLAARGLQVVAEGRIRTPEAAAEARARGALAVTVGSAITRPEIITGWFTDALAAVNDREER